MCDYSGKLVAWMDGEVPKGEAADVESHLGACGECRVRLAAYEQASGTFEAYCQATLGAEARRSSAPHWATAACGAAAIVVAAAIAALLMLPSQRVSRTPAAAGAVHAEDTSHVVAPKQDIGDVKAAQRAASAAKRVRHRYVAPGARTENSGNETAMTPLPALPTQNTGEFPSEPPIQIDIPAEAMFPPGAVPPGMSFTADLTIASDGSPERLGLRPRLAAFERRTNQP
jgi:hypothetical protein